MNGLFHGDEQVGLNLTGVTELCNQTLLPGLYRRQAFKTYTKRCIEIEQLEQGGVVLRELFACRHVLVG